MVGDLLGKGKPEEVEETINFSSMHPNSDSIFLYGTNKGALKMCDLRTNSNCDKNATVFKG